MITVIKTSRPVKVTQINTHATQINVRTAGQRASKVTSINVGREGPPGGGEHPEYVDLVNALIGF